MLEAARPEVPVLADYGLLYPPASLVLVEVTPCSWAEALFLEFVASRASEFPGAVAAASLREDFVASLSKSALPTVLVLRYLETLKSLGRRGSYTAIANVNELPRWLEASAKAHRFVYVYIADPEASTSERLVSEAASAVERALSEREVLQVTLFLDEIARSTVPGRRLEYAATVVYRVKEGKRGGASVLRVAKVKYGPKPPARVEFSVRSEGLVFEVLKEI